MDEHQYIEGIVSVDLNEIIESDLEVFLGILSDRMVGNQLLTDLSYSVESGSGGEISFIVSGCVLMILEERNEVETPAI